MLRGVTLKQIETFYWIAELGSFSATATQLHTTQPAISNRIRDLEQALAMQLFDPAARLPRLTPKGREVLAVCEQFLRLSQSLEKVAGAAESVGGLVRVGAADTIALTFLPELISRLNEKYPQIDLELSVDLSLNLQARLSDRDLDIAFLVGPIGDPQVTSRPLGEAANVWACSPGIAAIIGRRKVRPSELAQFPILTHSRGSHHHQMVVNWFDSQGQRPARIHGCNSLSTMFQMTIAGLGVTVLPTALAMEHAREKRLVLLTTDQPLPPNRFLLAYQSRSFDSTIAVIADMSWDLAHRSSIFKPIGTRRMSASRQRARGESVEPR